MQRKMKPVAKLLLVLMTVAIVTFLVKTFAVDEITVEESFENVTQTVKEDFNYHTGVSVQYDKPQNGQLRAVVECGASGFNAFIINLDEEGRWEKVKYQWGTSFVIDNFNSKEEIIKSLKDYILWFINYGVDGKDIHFVISSGALKTENGRNLSQAISQAGYFVNEINAESEGRYAFISSVPRLYTANCGSIDIGSGNSKTTNSNESCESPGAKFHKLNISGQVAAKQLYNCLNVLNGKEKVFIIGGVPYSMYKVHNTDNRYVQLREPSFYNSLKNDGIKAQNGLLLYEQIWNKFKGEIIFDSHANMAIGFLISLYS